MLKEFQLLINKYETFSLVFLVDPMGRPESRRVDSTRDSRPKKKVDPKMVDSQKVDPKTVDPKKMSTQNVDPIKNVEPKMVDP